MYTLLRTLSTRELLLEQLPTLGGSFLIATMFYKFGNFGLEALAFLATWLVLDALVQALDGLVSRSRSPRLAAVNAERYTGDSPTAPRTTERRGFDLEERPQRGERP